MLRHKKANYRDKVYDSVDWIPYDNSSGNMSFLRKIDTEVNLVSAYRRNHCVSFVDVSFDVDADDNSRENNSASVGNFGKLDPDDEPRKNSEEEKLQFFPSPTSEILPIVKENTSGVVPSFKFVYGAKCIPRSGTQGEDAFFTHSRALGVSDGVSGWYQYGIDSAEFSNQLMKESKGDIEIQLEREESIDVVSALSKAYKKSTAIGSATATIVALNENLLNGANLGDSGFICFTKRDNEYVCHGVTKERQHDFNTPFQLSNLPSDEEIKSIRQKCSKEDLEELVKTIAHHDFCHDPPTSADRYVLELHEDDIVILGTDGNN
jgi:serine/threonine protein phosphatase PrpC